RRADLSPPVRDVSGLSYAHRADLSPLRHDSVHRLRGDVLRGVVLGVFQQRAVPGRHAPAYARTAVWRGVAAEGNRDLRPVAPAAPQYADPAHLRHDRDLGAPRASGERPPGPQVGADPDDR